MENKISPFVQAIISHWVSERDRAVAEIQLCLDKKDISSIDYINRAFVKLNEANGIINTIQETFNLGSDKNSIENIKSELIDMIEKTVKLNNPEEDKEKEEVKTE